jgi:hypothetical protein
MGQGYGPRLGVAEWDETVRRLNAVLPDAKLLAEVVSFLREGTAAVPDGERYASAEQIFIEERTVVCSTEPDRGVVLYAKFSLGPLFADGRYTGVSQGGKLKVMYSAEGEWLDEFYTPAR